MKSQKMKAYRLSSSNKKYFERFEWTAIDEQRKLLWSERDLSFHGCRRVYLNPIERLIDSSKELLSVIYWKLVHWLLKLVGVPTESMYQGLMYTFYPYRGFLEDPKELEN